MRYLSFLAGVLICLVCILSVGCPKQPTTSTNATANRGQTTTPPVQTPPVQTPPVQTSGANGESTVTNTQGNTTNTEGENDPRIMALFSEYTSWPPAAITAEEKAILKNAVVVLETTKGIIKIKLFPDEAPIHSANFVKLVRDGFYNGLTFHRVMQNFMSQGGDPKGDGSGGLSYELPAEIKMPHRDGSIASAMMGNPQNNTSACQFYLVRSGDACRHLDSTFTVFGQISEGQDVNLALNITYQPGGGPGGSRIPGVVPDKILKAWVEMES